MNEGIISAFWSEEDGEWVATHSDFPSLSFLAETPNAAVAGLIAVING